MAASISMDLLAFDVAVNCDYYSSDEYRKSYSQSDN